jgi:hypothetical protein
MMKIWYILIGVFDRTSRTSQVVWKCHGPSNQSVTVQKSTLSFFFAKLEKNNFSNNNYSLKVAAADFDILNANSDWCLDALCEALEAAVAKSITPEIWDEILARVLFRMEDYTTWLFHVRNERVVFSLKHDEVIIKSPECEELSVKIPGLFYNHLFSAAETTKQTFRASFPPVKCRYTSIQDLPERLLHQRRILGYLSDLAPQEWFDNGMKAVINFHTLTIESESEGYSLTVPLSLSMQEFLNVVEADPRDISAFLRKAKSFGCLDPTSWAIIYGHRNEGEGIAKLFTSASFVAEGGSSKVDLSCWSTGSQTYAYTYIANKVRSKCDPNTYTGMKENKEKQYQIKDDNRPEETKKRNGEVAYKFCKTLYLRAQDLVGFVEGIADGTDR